MEIQKKLDAQKHLLPELRGLIDDARQQVAQLANAILTTLYWEIGRRIQREILAEKRVGYGKRIVAALGRQLGWTHFRTLLPIKDPLKRDFYAEMCRIERWSVRTLMERGLSSPQVEAGSKA
jgi:hypothetical protein